MISTRTRTAGARPCLSQPRRDEFGHFFPSAAHSLCRLQTSTRDLCKQACLSDRAFALGARHATIFGRWPRSTRAKPSKMFTSATPTRDHSVATASPPPQAGTQPPVGVGPSGRACSDTLAATTPRQRPTATGTTARTSRTPGALTHNERALATASCAALGTWTSRPYVARRPSTPSARRSLEAYTYKVLCKHGSAIVDK
jgi:hypothetical protein